MSQQMRAGPAGGLEATPAPIPVYTMRDMGLAERIPGFNVQALEERFAQPPKNILRAHRHDYHHVVLVTAGGGRLWVDFEERTIEPPMLLQLGPGVVHGWQPAQLLRGYVIHFDRSFFAADARDPAEIAEMPLFCAFSGTPVLTISAEQRALFEMLARAMLREYRGQARERAAALRSYLRIWLIEARRISEGWHPERWNDRGTELTGRFLALVRENFRTISSVSEYAVRLRVTPSHLNDTVRRTMGKTAGHLIRERVLLEAKRLLRHSHLSVAEVAYHLNFGDPSYFARFFRRQTGQSPAAFRGHRLGIASS